MTEGDMLLAIIRRLESIDTLLRILICIGACLTGALIGFNLGRTKR
jgi:hypothetical protein